MSSSGLAYLNNLDNAHYQSKDIEIDEVKKYLHTISGFAPEKFFFPFSLFALDYSKRQYQLFKSPQDGCWGYDARDYMNFGLEFTLDRFHKEDFKAINQSFKVVIDSLKETPAYEHDQLIFTLTYRVKNKKGEYRTAFQKCKYITSVGSGQPIYSCGFVMDITPVKPNDTIICLVDKYSGGNAANYENLRTEYFYPDLSQTVLTKREKEVVSWLAEGLSSKQIADKMCLAENTIANHRKSMLRKTNTKNVAQLIRYAIEYRII